jgi:two-component system cell cycle response regulator
MAAKGAHSIMPLPLRRRSDLDSSGSHALRALVVDDDLNYRRYVGMLLQKFDFEVTHAADGDEAATTLEDCVFDLLIIDCEMPRLNGMALIEHVRSDHRCADTYALMLTAHEDLDTKIAALRAGFDDFLMKSTPDQEIVAKLGAARRLILRQRRLDNTVRQLYGLATRDELTGLFNRRYFFTEAERLLGEGTPINLVLFDLDRFKSVNDTYGHLAGDRILRDVGSLFLSRTRHQDIIARYGGDEFVLLVPNTGIDEVQLLAGRMEQELAGLQWTFGEDMLQIGVTTGVASSTLLQHPTVPQLLNAGDRDLYKNKWVRTHPDLDPSLYEYPVNRADRISEMLEFRGRPIDVALRQTDEH